MSTAPRGGGGRANRKNRAIRKNRIIRIHRLYRFFRQRRQSYRQSSRQSLGSLGSPEGALIRPRRDVLRVMRSTNTRGDRDPQCASEANGVPEHSLALSLSTKRRDKVWRQSVSLIHSNCLLLLPPPRSGAAALGGRQSVSAKHPLNPTLNLTLKRHASSTRLLHFRVHPFAVASSLFSRLEICECAVIMR